MTKTFWKWCFPFLILYFTILNSEFHQFLVGETINANGANASLLSTSIYNSENTKSNDLSIRLDSIVTIKKIPVKDPFKPSNLGMGLNKRIPQNPLQGIEIEKDRTFAIIAGKKLSIGERIFGMRLINIFNHKVVLAGNGKVRVYYLF